MQILQITTNCCKNNLQSITKIFGQKQNCIIETIKKHKNEIYSEWKRT